MKGKQLESTKGISKNLEFAFVGKLSKRDLLSQTSSLINIVSILSYSIKRLGKVIPHRLYLFHSRCIGIQVVHPLDYLPYVLYVSFPVS